MTVCLDRICELSSMLNHLTPPMGGNMIKTQLFGKHDFKGFCGNFVFLILPRICSQKIKDSESKLIHSSIFMVSPPRSQDKRWLTLPHFTPPIWYWYFLGIPNFWLPIDITSHHTLLNYAYKRQMNQQW